MRGVYVCNIYREKRLHHNQNTHTYIYKKRQFIIIYCLANRDIYIKTWRTQYTHAAVQSLVSLPFLFTFCQCAFSFSLSLTRYDRFSFIYCALCSFVQFGYLYVLFSIFSHSTLFTDLYYIVLLFSIFSWLLKFDFYSCLLFRSQPQLVF